MTDKIFNVENGKVVINENCLLIPWLKAIVDKYEDNINALCYVKYYSELIGTYSNYEEDIKQEELLKDFPGDYKLTDKEICVAIDKCTSIWMSDTTLDHFYSMRILVQKLSKYAKTVILKDSKEDNNITSARGLVKDCLRTIKDFRNIEKIVEEEILKTRGDKEIAYDLL